MQVLSFLFSYLQTKIDFQSTSQVCLARYNIDSLHSAGGTVKAMNKLGRNQSGNPLIKSLSLASDLIRERVLRTHYDDIWLSNDRQNSVTYLGWRRLFPLDPRFPGPVKHDSIIQHSHERMAH
jgi:hypothetical protein